MIAPESPHYNAHLTKRVDLNDELAVFWVAPDGEPIDFEPGQYFTIGVDVDGKLVMRPYSVASSPREKDSGYELLRPPRARGRLHAAAVGPARGRTDAHARAEGPLPARAGRRADARLHLERNGHRAVHQHDAHLRLDGAPRRTIVLHGVSYADDLGYREVVEGHQRAGTYPCVYIPTISRPKAPENAGWSERTGRVETIIDDVLDELDLTPDNAIAYICGNPEMIQNADVLLTARGFPEPQIKKDSTGRRARPRPRGRRRRRRSRSGVVVVGRPRTMIRTSIVVLVAIVATGCSLGGPAAEATPATASPSPTVTTAPPAATTTPSPTARFGPRDIAEVVTTDLVVRSAPGTGSDSRIYQIRLASPTLLYIFDGPTFADGYDWYLVLPASLSYRPERLRRRLGRGRNHGEEYWIGAADPDCPGRAGADRCPFGSRGTWRAPGARP